jgi:ankyrin repeat protein
MGGQGNAKKHHPTIGFGASPEKQPEAPEDTFEPMDVDIPEAESSPRNQAPTEDQNPQPEPPKKQLPLQRLFKQVDSHLREGTPVPGPLLGDLSKKLLQRKENVGKLFRHLQGNRGQGEFETAMETLRKQFPDEPEPVDSPKFLLNLLRLPHDIKLLIFKYAFESKIVYKLMGLSGRSAAGKERRVSREDLLNLKAIGFKNKINTTYAGNSVLDEALSMRKKGIFRTFLEPLNTSKAFRAKQANSCSQLGFPLLNIAILTNQSDEADLLLNNGADPLKNDSLGNNALDYASLMGKQELLERLIQKVQEQVTEQRQKIRDSYRHTPELLEHFIKEVRNPLTPQKIVALNHQCAMQRNQIESIHLPRRQHSQETRYRLMRDAIQAGSIERVLTLLALGVEPGSTLFIKRHQGNFTPVYRAAQYGKADILKLLIEAGGEWDIVTTTDNNFTPFLKAARENHQDVIRILSEMGVNLYHKTNSGYNAADLAQNQGHVGMLRLLHKLAPSLFHPEDQGDWTLAHYAAQKGQPDILRLLSELEPALIYEGDRDGDTPAHAAAANGKVESLRVIHELAPALLGEKNSEGSTPAHVAVANGKLDSLRVIYELAPTLLGESNSEGLTPADLAVIEGHSQVIKVLHELDPHLLQAVDGVENTHARSAIEHGKSDLLPVLYGLQPQMFRQLDLDGKTLAQYAAANGNLAALKAIHQLEPGLLYLPGSLDLTPAHSAVEKHQLEVLSWLNEVAPNLLRKSNDLGISPIDLAERREQVAVIRHLQGMGIQSPHAKVSLANAWKPYSQDVFMGDMDEYSFSQL